MKFHSLMAVALLLLAFDSAAVLLHPEAFLAPQNTAAAAIPDEGGSAGDAAGAWVYRNGDLVLDMQDTAGAEILRASLAFLQDVTAAEAVSRPAAASQPLPEPLPLSLLGLGFAALGWTRRGGNLFGRLKLDLHQRLFPWPALSWLD